MKANEIMKIRRQELGLTQKEVADRVGVTEATVSRWESGDIKNMRRDRIAALARVIDVPPAVLMDWEDYDAELIGSSFCAIKKTPADRSPQGS